MSRKVPLTPPGEILAEEWLAPMGLSQYALARTSPRVLATCGRLASVASLIYGPVIESSV